MSTLKVNTKLIDGKSVNFEAVSSGFVKDIKKTIADKFYKEYLPEQTVLEYNGNVVHNDLMVKLILPPNTQTTINLVQRQAKLWEVGGLSVDPNKEDPVSCQKGVAKLKCGHEIGRQTLQDKIQKDLKKCQLQFSCGKSVSEGKTCPQLLTKNEIILICGLSLKQTIKLEDDLSLNWTKRNTKKCPDCNETICIIGLSTRRVRCPRCKTKDFCYDCRDKWNADKNGKCANEGCLFKRTLVKNGSLDRKFEVYDKNVKKTITVMTPECRACPRNCGNIINNHKACKHTSCPCMNMGNSFCFICLGLYENGKWPCGKYNDYCGKVAPNQDLN